MNTVDKIDGGHKEKKEEKSNIPKIWLEVRKNEKERKEKETKNKLKKK